MIKNLFSVTLFLLILFGCQTNQKETIGKKNEIEKTEKLSVGIKQIVSSTI